MLRILQQLFILLTVLAVGSMQAVGVQAGFLCQCTGSVVAEQTCDPHECHPGEAHHHDHSDHNDEEDNEHDHAALRTPLDVASHAVEIAVPPVVYYTLPGLDLEELLAKFSPEAKGQDQPQPKPPQDTGQPISQRVTKTTVLLV